MNENLKVGDQVIYDIIGYKDRVQGTGTGWVSQVWGKDNVTVSPNQILMPGVRMANIRKAAPKK